MDEKEAPASALPGEPEPVAAAPATDPPETTARPARRRGGGFAILLALVATALAGVALWRAWTLERALEGSRDGERAALLQRVDELAGKQAQARDELEALGTRLADADAVNRSLREEFLGLTERSRNLEDAVSHLAEQRLTGRDALALNEAEFLLQLGAERLALFHDVQAAQQAYRLADSALAAAEDPVFASVRQTISAERQALAASGFLPTRATLATLERVRRTLADLPVAQTDPSADDDDDANPSRLVRLLERFVRVRHEADAAADYAVRDLALARTLVAIDLRSAEAALLARDPEVFQAALARVRAGIERVFDAGDAAVRATLDEIERLAATPLAPKLPELGSALTELRNLRTTRALAHPPAPAAVPAAPTEAPGTAAPQAPDPPSAASGNTGAEVAT